MRMKMIILPFKIAVGNFSSPWVFSNDVTAVTLGLQTLAHHSDNNDITDVAKGQKSKILEHVNRSFLYRYRAHTKRQCQWTTVSRFSSVLKARVQTHLFLPWHWRPSGVASAATSSVSNALDWKGRGETRVNSEDGDRGRVCCSREWELNLDLCLWVRENNWGMTL